MQSCAVIGCGPAGMVASATLRQHGLLVTCFEQGSEPGGIWALNARELFSPRGVLSPVHPSMRTILPKDLMSFSDVRFDFTTSSQYPHHSEVRHYLHQYATQKGVAGLTRFNTKVSSVRYDNEKDFLWKLITVNMLNGDVMEWSFDRVCVCTGQTQEVRYPPGLRERLADFQKAGGEVHHSAYVKDFRALRRKKVVVVGDGVSAFDLSQELVRAGAEVVHSSLLPPTMGTLPRSSSSSNHNNSSEREHKKSENSTNSDASTSSSLWRQTRHEVLDFATSVVQLCARLPGWRQDRQKAHDIITTWMRFRTLSMRRIPRVGPPLRSGAADEGEEEAGRPSQTTTTTTTTNNYNNNENTANRDIVFGEDPLLEKTTDELIAELRREQLALKRQQQQEQQPQQQPTRENEKSEAAAAAAAATTTRTTKGKQMHASVSSKAKEVLVTDIDAVIFATGYTIRFPFLSPEMRRIVEAEPVLLLEAPQGDKKQEKEAEKEEQSTMAVTTRQRRGLYMGALYAKNPSIAFIGTQKDFVPPFLLFEAQSRFVAFAFTKRLQDLPATEADMLAREREWTTAYRELQPHLAEEVVATPQPHHHNNFLLHQSGNDSRGTNHHSCVYNAEGWGLHSALYYNVLQQQLEVSSKETYTSKIMERKKWFLQSTIVRIYHKFRSMAPLKRKKQHVLFSNEI